MEEDLGRGHEDRDVSEDGVEVNGGPTIPLGELTFRAVRAGGPGGQHVNTSATKVELTWDVAGSPSLTDEERARLRDKLGTRIDERGTLRVVAGDSRSQHQNREAALERFAELVARALKKPKPRRRTKPPRAAKEARLKAKKQRSQVKKQRGRVEPGE
jgi:ribosome-associated protein